MGSNRSPNLARKNLPRRRSSAPTPRPFVPSILLERPVIWESDEDKNAYWNGMNKALGKVMGRGRQRRSAQYPVVRPEELKVVQLREESLRSSSIDLMMHHDRQETIERLASLLQERLYKLLQDTPEKLKVAIGELACFTEPISNKAGQQVIGAAPNGWRGFKAKYPVCDETGQTAPLHQLALEGAASSDALLETNTWFNPTSIVANPYLPFITNPKPWLISQDECRSIGSKLGDDEHFPRTLMLGDPILTLKLGTLPDEVIRLPIRNLDNPISRQAA